MRNITQANTVAGNPDSALPVSLNSFARQLDRTPCTVWRWTKCGIIDPADILIHQIQSERVTDPQSGAIQNQKERPHPGPSQRRAS